MSVPEALLADVRSHRCLGLIDNSKSAHRVPFGILRSRILAAGRILMLFSDTADSVPIGLGYTKAFKTIKGVWAAAPRDGSDLDILYATTRNLRCSSFAIIVERTALGELAAELSSAGVINNPNFGYGRRLVRLSKYIAREYGNATLLSFHERSDIFRLCYNDESANDVIASLENLRDYR